MSLWKILAIFLVLAAFVLPYVGTIALAKRIRKHKKERRGFD